VGLLLLPAIAALQSIVFSRAVGVYETKRAEGLAEGAPQAVVYLERALAADPTNGWARWLLSKQHVHLALTAGNRAEAAHKSLEQAKAALEQAKAALDPAKVASEERRVALCQVNEKQEMQKRNDHLARAEQLATSGSLTFNGVECFKQLASIYLRQERPQEAERYLQIVSRIKPDDIEAIERLGLIKLNAQKWGELRELANQILRKHPYSANAYFYKAFIAREEKNRDEFIVNVRLAYLMMRQKDKTGEPFFDQQQLEQIATLLKVTDKPPTPEKKGGA